MASFKSALKVRFHSASILAPNRQSGGVHVFRGACGCLGIRKQLLKSKDTSNSRKMEPTLILFYHKDKSVFRYIIVVCTVGFTHFL